VAGVLAGTVATKPGVAIVRSAYLEGTGKGERGEPAPRRSRHP
jgi:hypothetical protein